MNLWLKISILIAVLLKAIILNGQVLPPYFNDFENLEEDTLGWSHYATEGTDDWEIGEPSGEQFFEAYSGLNAWCTDLDTSLAENSTRFLITPYFDLSGEYEYVVGFRHRVRRTLGMILKVQFRNGSLGSWSNLPYTAYDLDMDDSFFDTPGDTYERMEYNTSEITGSKDSIQFRFQAVSVSVEPEDEGWVLDDFFIQVADINFRGLKTDTIFDVTKYFTTIETNFWMVLTDRVDGGDSPIIERTNFYFSEDTIWDETDIYLTNFITTHTYGVYEVENYHYHPVTLELPEGLENEYYYIIYVVDELNEIEESNEADNEGRIVLSLAPISETNYVDDFEDDESIWNKDLIYPYESQWYHGYGNDFNIEKAHSGTNQWSVSYRNMDGLNYLETPYIDLSGTENNSFCFFGRMIHSESDYGMIWGLNFLKPVYDTTSTTFPLFYEGEPDYELPIEYPRIPNEWDCYCFDIDEYDDFLSTKFRITKDWYYLSDSPGHAFAIDDVYIGEKKPDLSIEGSNENLFTTSDRLIDTLRFYYFNSGLVPSVVSSARFYWSADSLFDPLEDILLEELSLPGLEDTSYVKLEWEYNKFDTEIENYYIIYEIDPDYSVDEMREYNNIGYFKVHQQEVIVAPYLNDFEEEIVGWRHNSSLNADNWMWGVPDGDIFTNAISGEKSWVTSDTGIVSNNSEMHLYSPVFDLTEMEHPILEFSSLSHINNYYAELGYAQSNIQYSIDGGSNWHYLEHQGFNRKGLYEFVAYDHLWGGDEMDETHTDYKMVQSGGPCFPQYDTYPGRDFLENYRTVVDIDTFSNFSNIQFRFNVANSFNPSEGMIVDDFGISDASYELYLEDNRNLMVNHLDKYIVLNFGIRNDANATTSPFKTKIFLSEDTLLSLVDDYLLHTEFCSEILPYERYYQAIRLPLDIENYGEYNYVIFEIDSDEDVAELNEDNNLGIYNLNMDTLIGFNEFYEEDFEDELIDGWAWHVYGADADGPRFRHKKLLNDPANLVDDGYWFLDPMDLSGTYYNNWIDYGIYYLESPGFDLSNTYKAKISFDLICRGLISQSGGNLQYSTDGGDTWYPVFQNPGTFADNWYYLTDFDDRINSINNENGWYNVPDFTYSQCDISHLVGSANTKFRIQFRSEQSFAPTAIHGVRLDNFKLESDTMDLVMIGGPEEYDAPYGTTILSFNYSIDHRSTYYTYDQTTLFYWSNDTVFDETDLCIDTLSHGPFPSNSIVDLIATINRPDTISQLEYYLFYVIDGIDALNETSEINNVSRVKVKFSTLADIEENNSQITIESFQEKFIISGFSRKVSSAALLDSKGQIIKSFDEELMNEINLLTIKKAGLANGVYLLKVSYGDHFETVKLLVID